MALQNLEHRSGQVTESLGRLINAVDGAAIGLGNVTNKLNQLQQNQFVESRVQEEVEEDIATVSKVESAPTEVEATKKLLDESVKMLGKCYEKVPLDQDEESDAEDDKLRIAYKPINPYEHRRRPYIIGTKEWLEKYHIGLQSSEEDEEPGSEEEISETESHLTATSQPPPIPPEPEPVQYFIPPAPKPAAQSIVIPEKTTIPINQATEATIFRPNQTKPFVPNLFDDEPPELDSISVSTKAPNLFTESDDENQNFLPVATPKMVPNNIFFDEPPDETDQKVVEPPKPSLVNDFFNQNLSRQIASQAAAIATKKPPVSNLFDGDSEEEDEVIATPKLNKTAPANIVSSEIEYTLHRNVTPKREEKVEQPKPMAQSEKVTKVKKVTNLFDDDSDEDDFFLPIKSKKPAAVAKESGKRTESRSAVCSLIYSLIREL